MRKKLLTVLATAALACTFIGSAGIVASAGMIENKPAGDGAIAADGQINLTNFKVVETAEGDAAAYGTTKGNYAVRVVAPGSSEGDQFLPVKPVSKDIMAKEDVEVRFQMDFYSFAANWSGITNQWIFNPLGKSLGDNVGYALLFDGRAQVIYNIAPFNNARTAEDPKLMVTLNGATEAKELAMGANTDVGGTIWREPDLKTAITKNGYATLYADLTLKDDYWVDVELGIGLADESGAIAEDTICAKATFENWGKYNPENDIYFGNWFRYATDMIIDDVRISATYTENSEIKTETIAHYDMEDQSKIEKGWVEGISGEDIIITTYEYVSTSELGISVTNPAVGTGIVTRAALATDKTLPLNLELETNFVLKNLSAGQKVGLGFGFNSSRSLSGAHKYIYFTNVDGKVMLSAESVDADGTETELMTAVEVAGATIGTDAAGISLKLAGKNDDLEISVGNNEAVVLEGFDPDGFFAIMHKGEGELSYLVKNNLTMTGYEFLENSEKATTVTSNFNGNYLNSNKFQYHTNVAPENHMTKGDKTAHDLTGMVVENGKLGFYASSTGTRLVFNEKYADFVMQFDYISMPTQQRGQLVGLSRPSAFYMIFGMKEGGLAITDASVYTIGISEGIADPNMYGNNGTVISALAKAYACGGATAGLSQIVETTEPDEFSIPQYNAGGYDSTKENNNVAKWWNQAEGGVYNFYNKTSRVKLVAVNNFVSVYVAEVDTETGAVKGDYVQIMKFKAEDTEGYVGIATDSPGWCEVDNLAITPVTREEALKITAIDQLSATTIVSDIAPADMDEDQAPTPLAKPALVADVENKKVTWAAVEGAKEYIYSVKLGTEFVIEETKTTATEIDMSAITAEGTYKVVVEAVPEDAESKLSSRADIGYTVVAEEIPGTSEAPATSEAPTTSEESQTSEGSATSVDSGATSNDDNTDSVSCFGSVAGISVGIVTLIGAALVACKKRED